MVSNSPNAPSINLIFLCLSSYFEQKEFIILQSSGLSLTIQVYTWSFEYSTELVKFDDLNILICKCIKSRGVATQLS